MAVARKVQQPTAHNMVNLKRIVRYVMSTLNAYMELRLNPGRDANTIELYSDASWASTEQRTSVSGIGDLQRSLDGQLVSDAAQRDPQQL